MFCGISSFRHVDENPWSPDSKKKKRSSSSRRSKSNPYSSRGLDKFTSVLAELEARKEKIMAMSRGNQQGIAMVHFMYSNSHDWIPIIVRLREPDCSTPKTSKPKSKELPPPPSPKADAVDKQPEKKAKKCLSRGDYWWRPYAYMPLLLLLILLCLLMFGRVFAICCTSVWWYSVPMLNGGDHTVNARRRSFKKKDYVRRLSDKRLPAAGAAAPQRMGAGVVLQELASPGSRVNHGKRSG